MNIRTRDENSQIIPFLITKLMKLILFILIGLSAETIMASDTFTFLHYNIKELDSIKLKANSDQIKAVKKVISNYKFDLFSINEIQYDFPNVPTPSFQTTGENLTQLSDLLSLKDFTEHVFAPANTGLNAKTMENGHYYTNPNSPQARANADQVNFGIVPGQYSTGLLSKYKVLSKRIFSKVKWKDFNTKIDLSKFKTADGKAYPTDAELFDKNFSDITVSINNKEVHIVLLHTVPAYNFGNPDSPNYKRNQDQLRFLEWYLTGSTDLKVQLEGIKPLDKSDYFIASGDWNTAFDSLSNPGSLVLRRMFKKINSWIPEKNLSFTNEGYGYAEAPFRLMLDYMATSKNIEIVKGEIIHPIFKRVQLGCGKLNSSPPLTGKQIIVDWKKGSQTCRAIVDESYKLFKDASDHYPIIGTFKLNE